MLFSSPDFQVPASHLHWLSHKHIYAKVHEWIPCFLPLMSLCSHQNLVINLFLLIFSCLTQKSDSNHALWYLLFFLFICLFSWLFFNPWSPISTALMLMCRGTWATCLAVTLIKKNDFPLLSNHQLLIASWLGVRIQKFLLTLSWAGLLCVTTATRSLFVQKPCHNLKQYFTSLLPFSSFYILPDSSSEMFPEP